MVSFCSLGLPTFRFPAKARYSLCTGVKRGPWPVSWNSCNNDIDSLPPPPLQLANQLGNIRQGLHTLQMKGRWEFIINVWFKFMYSQNETSRPRYFQNRIMMLCLPISTSMYLWVIYIFPGLGCLLCCSQIGRLILGIYKSLTDTWMCRNGEQGQAVSILWIHKSDFRYSAINAFSMYSLPEFTKSPFSVQPGQNILTFAAWSIVLICKSI